MVVQHLVHGLRFLGRSGIAYPEDLPEDLEQYLLHQKTSKFQLTGLDPVLVVRNIGTP